MRNVMKILWSKYRDTNHPVQCCRRYSECLASKGKVYSFQAVAIRYLSLFVRSSDYRRVTRIEDIFAECFIYS